MISINNTSVINAKRMSKCFNSKTGNLVISPIPGKRQIKTFAKLSKTLNDISEPSQPDWWWVNRACVLMICQWKWICFSFWNKPIGTFLLGHLNILLIYPMMIKRICFHLLNGCNLLKGDITASLTLVLQIICIISVDKQGLLGGFTKQMNRFLNLIVPHPL